MDYTFTSPALVFNAISLLMLAYTNRFLTLSELARNLHKRYMDSGGTDLSAKGQIKNLALRIRMIRWTQLFGALAFFLGAIAMITYIFISANVSLGFFIAALTSLLISLALLMIELQISVNAINIQFDEMRN